MQNGPAMTLWRTQATAPFWLVEATLRASGDVAISSGDQDHEWYAIVAAADGARFRAALADAASDETACILELLRAVFGRDASAANPFEEIKRFLDTHDVPWRQDHW